MLEFFLEDRFDVVGGLINGNLGKRGWGGSRSRNRRRSLRGVVHGSRRGPWCGPSFPTKRCLFRTMSIGVAVLLVLVVAFEIVASARRSMVDLGVVVVVSSFSLNI